MEDERKVAHNKERVVDESYCTAPMADPAKQSGAKG
jgi:hypothetical protein